MYPHLGRYNDNTAKCRPGSLFNDRYDSRTKGAGVGVQLQGASVIHNAFAAHSITEPAARAVQGEGLSTEGHDMPR